MLVLFTLLVSFFSPVLGSVCVEYTSAGIVETPVYSTQTDPKTGEKKLTSNVKSTNIDYTMEWDPKTVKKYIKDAEELSDSSQTWSMSYKAGERYIIVDTEKEFLNPTTS